MQQLLQQQGQQLAQQGQQLAQQGQQLAQLRQDLQAQRLSDAHREICDNRAYNHAAVGGGNPASYVRRIPIIQAGGAYQAEIIHSQAYRHQHKHTI
jgi:hypothetical protein